MVKHFPVNRLITCSSKNSIATVWEQSGLTKSTLADDDDDDDDNDNDDDDDDDDDNDD
jgi:hypothetical protein